MNNSEWTDDELIAWLDEMLPADRIAALESELRDSERLRNRVAAVSRSRDDGVHTVGQIWRRNRTSCPSRAEIGSFLLGTLDDDVASYVEFHVRTIGCRYCAANLNDLEDVSAKTEETTQRRHRFFQSSAGFLHGTGDGSPVD